MSAITIPVPGGPDALTLARLPVPSPGPGEVLIQVAAAGVNAPDLSQRRGSYDPPPGASPHPGLEVSGVIAALGAGVEGWSPGDLVIALTNGGGYAEYVAVPAGQVLPLPDGWSLVAGAALPETFFTVQQHLPMRAGLAPGMDVLIHGAAGGIGGAAIQITRFYGANPIAVVSTADKAAYARSLGAVATIDHTSEDFVARTLELTGGKGAERILDVVGGDHLARNIDAAARNGHIVQVSAASGKHSEISAFKLMRKWLTISGATLRPQAAETKAAIAASLRREVWPGLADGRIVPPRIQAVPLADAPAAHRALERRETYGKLILLTEFGYSAGGGPDNSIEKL